MLARLEAKNSPHLDNKNFHLPHLTSTAMGKYISNIQFCSFQNIWFARPHHRGEEWEAGEKPALPRNCKRGNRDWPLGTTVKGKPGKASCSTRMLDQADLS
jgi:hypothetical protein